jgi:hypothetical protein
VSDLNDVKRRKRTFEQDIVREKKCRICGQWTFEGLPMVGMLSFTLVRFPIPSITRALKGVKPIWSDGARERSTTRMTMESQRRVQPISKTLLRLHRVRRARNRCSDFR